MSTATAPAPWWTTAPNPPCMSWCDQGHEAEAFADGGAFMCIASVAASKWFTVEIQQCVSVGPDADPDDATMPLHRDPVSIYVHHASDVMDGLTSVEAREYVAAIQGAMIEAARRVDEANLSG